MSAAEPVRHIPPGERVPGHATPGMVREQAVATDGLWAGFVRTAAQDTSGWHHHGDYETSIYVVSGQVRMESGPGGVPPVVDFGGPLPPAVSSAMPTRSTQQNAASKSRLLPGELGFFATPAHSSPPIGNHKA